MTGRSLPRKVRIAPYRPPGGPEAGQRMGDLNGQHAAVPLAKHGQAVDGKDLIATVRAAEELEAAAKLPVAPAGMTIRLMDEANMDAPHLVFGKA